MFRKDDRKDEGESEVNVNKGIIVSVALYAFLMVAMIVFYLNIDFGRGNDAAGQGMARGLTLLYGIGILFFVGLVQTIVNCMFFKKITCPWIKILAFVPIFLPVAAIFLLN
jgi:hypothetical protein